MKKLGLMIILAVSTTVIPYAAHAFGSGAEPPKAPPTFVEETIPEGKAIIYIYSPPSLVPAWNRLILEKSGPLTPMCSGFYYSFITNPGRIELFIVAGSGGQYGQGIVASKLVINVAEGQSYFMNASPGSIVPIDKAKTDHQILYCKKIES